MSWDGHETLCHGESIADWIRETLTDEEACLRYGLPLGLNVVAAATTPTAVYLAARDHLTIFAVICPYVRDARHDGQFFIRFRHEDAEPDYHDCPLTILNKLDPPRTPDAAAWREACREREVSLPPASTRIGQRSIDAVAPLMAAHIQRGR